MTRDELKTKKIGVLMGGLSAEREISLSSGGAVHKALLARGYDAVAIDVDRDLPQVLVREWIDVAFICLHGRYGEDGAVQGVLELMGIPYTGSGVLASALAMNKIFAKQAFAAAGLTITPHRVLVRGETFDAVAAGIDLPVVVKPSQEGSSVGVSIVKKAEELAAALEAAFRYDNEILVEKFVKGREIQVGILDDRAMGAIEIVPKKEFYDFEAKYTDGMAEHICPPVLPADLYRKLLAEGEKAHRALGCAGYSRVDFLVTEGGDCFLLEVNTLPGMTALSLLPEIAQKEAGIAFEELVERILVSASLKIQGPGTGDRVQKNTRNHRGNAGRGAGCLFLPVPGPWSPITDFMRDLHVKTRIQPANKSRNRVKKERKPINWRPLITWGSRAVLGALAVAVVGGAGYKGYAFASRYEIAVLQVEAIEVSKLRHLTRDEVLGQAGVRRGDSMLGLRLRRIGEQLAKNPWIEKVQVRRYFPHTIRIEVVEREPVAVVNMGFLYYLDAKGEVFKPLTQGDSLNFPVITGITEDDLARDPKGAREMLTGAVALMDMLKKGRAFTLADVSEVHIDKGFGLTLFTAGGGVPVRLGKDGYETKLARFATVYGELKTQMTAVEYIDCDYQDKIIVKKG